MAETCLLPIYDPEHGFKDVAFRVPRLLKTSEIVDRYYTGTIYHSEALTVGARGPEAPDGLPPFFVRYGQLAPVFLTVYHLRAYLELLKLARSLDTL